MWTVIWTAIKSFVTNIKVYLYLAVGTAFAALLGYAEFEKHERKTAEDSIAVTQAKQETANVQQQVQHLEIKNEVQAEVQKMPAPSADPVAVSVAPADSSAGKLRDSWSRD